MDEATLGDLPDHLLLDIVDYLNTARDVSRLGSSSRRLHNLVQQDGWRSFVRNSFPWADISSDEGSRRWSSVADRLTYLDRCWETRAIFFTMFKETLAWQVAAGARPPRGGQSVTFQCMLDALELQSAEEVLAVGAGEDLHVRWRLARGSEQDDEWKTLSGLSLGYTAGIGDVTAVSVIERNTQPEIVVARANGDIQLLNGINGEAFGRPVKRLVSNNRGDSQGPRSSPGRQAVTWIDWQPSTQMVASCRDTNLSLHALSDEDAKSDLEPVAIYDVSERMETRIKPLLRCVKFLGGNEIACGVGNTPEPLFWGHIRPTGIELSPIKPRDTELNIPVRRGSRTTVRAMERVGGNAGGNLLLSVWDDGALRLLDPRTPSDRDAVYRDRFQPYARSSSLLVYGTERFVAGASGESALRLFDFRWPKPYHHFDALPCSDKCPYPVTPDSGSMRNSAEGEIVAAPAFGDLITSAGVCDPLRQRVCRRHHESKLRAWRPDATVFLGSSPGNTIFSLAKPSDTSGSFYCGLRGAFMEATCMPGEDFARERTKHPPKGWKTAEYDRLPFPTVIMETGVNRCDESDWQIVSRMNKAGLFRRGRPGSLEAPQAQRHTWARLDSCFYGIGPNAPE